MSDYMKQNALNTAFQLLRILASGKRVQKQIEVIEEEFHIHFEKDKLLHANAKLLTLLQTIESETAFRLKEQEELLHFYFHKITIEEKDYENLSLFLFLTEDVGEHLNYPDFATYADFLENLSETKRCQLFLSMIHRYNHMYLRDMGSDEKAAKDPGTEPVSDLDIISAIMEMDLPLEIRWRIQDIFVHWESHMKKALPLLECAYGTLKEFEPQLEEYAQSFLSYWTAKIDELGGIEPFAEQLFPLKNIPKNPHGYVIYISFFRPFELGFHAHFPDENEVSPAPYEIVLGILYGELLMPQNPYMPQASEEDSETYLNALKLLSDKRRFEILAYLSEKPAYAGELVKFSGLTAATISHHMSQLAEASLIRLEKMDTKVYYSINKEKVQKCLEFCREKLHC